jgi:hypothetical protein
VGQTLFFRAMGLIYVVAFLSFANQGRALLGEDGLTPIARFVRAVPFRQAPSLFHRWHSDRALLVVAWTGVALGALAIAGASHPLTWLVLWLLYLSIVNVGQRWYAFGWESLLLEVGLLTVCFGPTVTPWLLRWLLFRLELGAGLIKLRGDRCWRDLTCLRYHHETQPLPGPLSWHFHHLPMWAHKAEVLGNHAAQLVLPVALVLPWPLVAVPAGLMVVTQCWLVVSGNFSWLNVLTIAIAIPLVGGTGGHAEPAWVLGLSVAYAGLVVVLSYRPARNLLSKRQRMNSSFDPLHLVNTYGAFGSISKVRDELVLEGADDLDGPWLPYELKAKPGDPMRRPRQVAPYHLRLDWLLWFVPLSPGYAQGWFDPLVQHLLQGDPATLKLFGTNPFPDRPPTFLRATMWRYRFTTRAERKATGAWWRREQTGVFLRPLSLR